MSETDPFAPVNVTREEWMQQIADARRDTLIGQRKPEEVIAETPEYAHIDSDGNRRANSDLGEGIKWLLDNANKTDREPNDLSGIVSSAYFDQLAKGEYTDEMSEDSGVKTFFQNRAGKLENETEYYKTLLPGIKKIFQHGVMEGQKRGFIPKNIDPETLRGAFDYLVIFVSDSMKYRSNMAAFYSGDIDQISLISGNLRQEAAPIVTHEVRHRIGGGTFQKDPGSGEIVRTRTGFQEYSSRRGRPSHTALDEALVEHTTLSILNGDWETIAPHHRADKGIYTFEREMLSLFLKISKGHVNLQTMVKANFEDTTPEGNTQERRKMIREINSVWKTGTLGRYERMCRLLGTDTARSVGTHTLVNKCLIAPKFDGEGNVTEKGYIDLEALTKELATIRGKARLAAMTPVARAGG